MMKTHQGKKNKTNTLADVKNTYHCMKLNDMFLISRFDLAFNIHLFYIDRKSARCCVTHSFDCR